MTPLRTLLAAALGAVLALALAPVSVVAPAAAAEGSYAKWGRTKAPDQTFHTSCHRYRYKYRVDPPTEEWYLETTLRGPKGKKLASDLFHFNADPKRGRADFKVCGASTQPGRFTIKAKVVYRDGFDETTVKLRPSRFRITRR